MRDEPLPARLLASFAVGGTLGMLGLICLVAHITGNPGLMGEVIVRGLGVGIMAVVIGGLYWIWRSEF